MFSMAEIARFFLKLIFTGDIRIFIFKKFWGQHRYDINGGTSAFYLYFLFPYPARGSGNGN